MSKPLDKLNPGDEVYRGYIFCSKAEVCKDKISKIRIVRDTISISFYRYWEVQSLYHLGNCSTYPYHEIVTTNEQDLLTWLGSLEIDINNALNTLYNYVNS